MRYIKDTDKELLEQARTDLCCILEVSYTTMSHLEFSTIGATVKKIDTVLENIAELGKTAPR